MIQRIVRKSFSSYSLILILNNHDAVEALFTHQLSKRMMNDVDRNESYLSFELSR